MKKIFELIAVAIFKVDTVLYKTFGFVSSFRSQSWARQSRRLQERPGQLPLWSQLYNQASSGDILQRRGGPQRAVTIILNPKMNK